MTTCPYGVKFSVHFLLCGSFFYEVSPPKDDNQCNVLSSVNLILQNLRSVFGSAKHENLDETNDETNKTMIESSPICPHYQITIVT